MLRHVSTQSKEDSQAFVSALSELRSLRGHLVTIRDMRYIDSERLGELEQSVTAAYESTAQECVEFLMTDGALAPYESSNVAIAESVREVSTVVELEPLMAQLEESSSGLDLLTELLGSIRVDDTCLLYTSPSPRDQRGSRMPSSA